MSRSELVRLMALVGVLLVLGVAVCAFDDDDNADLCLMTLALLGSTLALSPLPVVGRLELRRAPAYPSLLTDRPPPPPKA